MVATYAAPLQVPREHLQEGGGCDCGQELELGSTLQTFEVLLWLCFGVSSLKLLSKEDFTPFLSKFGHVKVFQKAP